MANIHLNIILSLFILISNSLYRSQPAPKPKARNVILLIGDGMGLSQISSSYYYKSETPHFSRFKHIGFINTSSSSHKITDSAAGATAFSAGKKTYNGAIGVDSTGKKAKTILEIAARKGLSTGLISTSSITHATPASFYAHVKSRNQHEDIATYLTDSKVDFFAGGGRMFFKNRKDSLDYIKKLTKKGFQMNTESLTPPAEFEAEKRYGYLLARDGMPKMLEGRGDFLPKATSMALEHLSQNRKGFFLMVEGSQIDWGGHNNDADYLVSEVLDFDQTLGVALDFAMKDKKTLVIVTADHETGGYSLSSTKKENGDSDYNKLRGTFSTGGHTATLIPVFAFGPGEEEFMGIYQNHEIFEKMLKAYKWD